MSNAEQRAKASEWAKARYRYRRAQGLCYQCAEPSDLAICRVCQVAKGERGENAHRGVFEAFARYPAAGRRQMFTYLVMKLKEYRYRGREDGHWLAFLREKLQHDQA